MGQACSWLCTTDALRAINLEGKHRGKGFTITKTEVTFGMDHDKARRGVTLYVGPTPQHT